MAAELLSDSRPGAGQVRACYHLNTAKALGLDLPSHLQQLADEVIE
jgi:hypothetical protein